MASPPNISKGAFEVYTFKASPFSSHTLLMSAFPEQGQGRSLLDVGCGNGHLSRLFADRGYQVTGIERRGGYSDSFPSNVELVEADLDQGIPPLHRKYDFILCADVLEHVRHPEELLSQLRELLAPGGMLVGSLPNSGNIWFRLNIVLGRFPQDEKGLFDRTHIHFYMWSGWKSLLESCGFSIAHVQPTGIPVGLMAPEGMQFSAPVRLAESVCYGMARLWMKLFAYQFIVQASPAGSNR